MKVAGTDDLLTFCFYSMPFRDDEATPRAAVNGGALSQVAMVSAAGEVCGALPATHSGED